MDEKVEKIPKIIWLFWYQGTIEAPFLVKKCIDSWIRKNPNRDVVIIDYTNLNSYIDLPEHLTKTISLNHLSDLLRLAVLSEYGGVWADASTLCIQPLDKWLEDVTQSGFFMFSAPAKDRLILSWFIASEGKCPLIIEFYKKFKAYWVENNFKKLTKIQYVIIDKLAEILNRSERTTKYWFNPLLIKILRVYPYFVFHYMFERVVSTSDESKLIWRNTSKLSAVPPHLIQERGFFSAPSNSMKELISESKTPLFKLSWKYDHTRYSSNTLLYYVLENLN